MRNAKLLKESLNLRIDSREMLFIDKENIEKSVRKALRISKDGITSNSFLELLEVVSW